ncbi:MAG: hypothetical protein LBJ72_10365 [Dysgonamonadaceae bacterium]|jgi:hypothetical protein|nr:hypothetical protein [Dysgonamonadaceae bacterium]
MRKLFALPVAAVFYFSAFAQTNLNSAWDEVKQKINDGTMNTGDYDLFGLGLGGLVNDFDLNGITGGGMKVLDFGKGGFMGDLFGGLFGGLFGKDLMGAMGIEELHNDASLNSNLTWGIVMTTKLLSPQINKREREIMTRQDTINMRIEQLYKLELLTVRYMSKKQSDAVDIEDEANFMKLAQDITYYYKECTALCDRGTGLDKTKQALQVKLLTRSTRIALKIFDFAKKDGNKNLLHNQDRDELITFVYDTLREMRGVFANAYRELSVAAHYSDLYGINN